MNIEQLKNYLTKIPNTQKQVYIEDKELEEENLVNDNDGLKIYIKEK